MEFFGKLLAAGISGAGSYYAGSSMGGGLTAEALRGPQSSGSSGTATSRFGHESV